MKIGTKSIWAVFFAGILAASLHHFLANHGPFYEGKDIDYWFSRKGTQGFPGGLNMESVTAFGKMGPAAAPYLREKLRQDDLTLGRIYWLKWLSLPSIAQSYLPTPSPPNAAQMRAAALIQMIGGSNFQAAAPDFIAAYNRAVCRRFHLPLNSRLDWPQQLADPQSPPFSQSASLQFTGRGDPYAAYEDELRRALCFDLSRIGGDDPRIMPLLLAAMRDSNLATANYLFGVDFPGIQPLDSAVKSAEPALLNALARAEPPVRSSIAICLGRLLPEHTEVIHPLARTLSDDDPSVRVSAARSLREAQTGLEEVIPGLCELLRSPETCGTAVSALSQLAGRGERAMLLLTNFLNSTNADIRAGAAEALGNAGPKAVAALGRLGELADSSRETHIEVRYQAAQSLWKIGRQPGPLIPFRIKVLKAREDSARWSAASFLGEAGPEAEAAVPALVEMLQSDASNRLRGKAAIVLGEIGPPARSAIPALRLALQDDYANVKEAAAEALRRIERDQTAK